MTLKEERGLTGLRRECDSEKQRNAGLVPWEVGPRREMVMEDCMINAQKEPRNN